ncbi:MAG: hypothetical protein ACMG6E_03010 [Candidatus Roizmanbacteria bacterium]
MLEEAIAIFFENLESGLSIHDALETDMALRASIAVSYSLADCIEEVEDYIDDGYSIAEIMILTAEDFEAAYESTAIILLGVEELAEDTETEIYAALAELYQYLEDGYTLTEALAANTYLTYVIEISSSFEDVLDEIYTAVEEGSSVKEAVEEYEDDISAAVITAAYAITDLAVQELESEVDSDNMQITINESIEALGYALEAGFTLEEALAMDESFETLYEEYSSLYEAINLFYSYYLETGDLVSA